MCVIVKWGVYSDPILQVCVCTGLLMQYEILPSFLLRLFFPSLLLSPLLLLLLLLLLRLLLPQVKAGPHRLFNQIVDHPVDETKYSIIRRIENFNGEGTTEREEGREDGGGSGEGRGGR